LVIVVLVIAFIAAVYLPGYLRLLSLKRTLGNFTHLIRTGKIVEAADYVADGECERALKLIKEYVPVGYEKDIQTLRVHRIEHPDSEYLVILIVRAEGADYRLAVKVRMHWLRQEGKWRFPLSRVDYSELLTEDWRRLDHMPNHE